MSEIARPLDGIRVLDLSRVLAGPYCSLMMADMGADVIKIENPVGGDDTRTFLEPNHQGHSVYFLAINRNKRSLALDLKAPEGRDIFLKLLADADVVLENFRTGVMERLGLGYDTLKAIRPNLIYCAISGYGRDGPNVDVPGYDPVSQAESGLMWMTGEADGPPTRTGSSLVDMVTGLYAVQALNAALRHREVTGEGRFIEATLHETALNMLVNFAADAIVADADPVRAGSTNQVVQPGGIYEASDGPFMAIMVTDAQFRRACIELFDRPDLPEDPKFATNAGRVRNGAELRAIVGSIFRTRACAEWVSDLRRIGAAAGKVATVSEAVSSDLVAARGMVQDVSHTAVGSYRALMGPVRLHDTAAVPRNGAPLLGEHSAEVLQELADLSSDEIASLARSGIVGIANSED